jgi:hypothetical protein
MEKFVLGDSFALYINGQLVAEEQQAEIVASSDVLPIVTRNKWKRSVPTDKGATISCSGFLSFRDSKYNGIDYFSAFKESELIAVRLQDEPSQLAYVCDAYIVGHTVSTKVADFGRFSLQIQVVNELSLVSAATPENLTAVQDNTQRKAIDLAWTDVASSTEIGVQIWRAPDFGQPDVDLNFELVGTAAANATTFNDDTCPNDDTAYAYRVRYENAGGVFSAFSNIARASTLAPALTLTTTADTSWLDVLLYAGAVYTPEWERGTTSKLFVFGNEHDKIRGIYTSNLLDPDENAGVIGAVDLSAFPALVEFIAPNQVISSLVLSEGLQTTSRDVLYDLTNSIITPAAAIPLIFNIILANGGTTTNSGGTYTGNAGFDSTSALPITREVRVGTLIFDLSDPEFSVAFQMVAALSAKNLLVTTINAVCEKFFNVSTIDSTFVVTFLETSIVEAISVRRIAGVSLVPKLYDTPVNAIAGGTTGLLADGLPNINDYLALAVSPTEDYGIRFVANDGITTGNVSEFTYRAAPTGARACGKGQDVLGLRAFASYGLRLITGTYTGKAITLRRVTGGTVADFYFNAAGRLRWLDTDLAPSLGETQSVETWAGASEVRVVTLYDQSGSNFDCTAVAARQPLLDRTVRGIRATAQGQGLFFAIGSVPSWLSTSNVTLTFVANFQTLNGNYGFDPNNVAGLCTIRNGVESNIPMFVSVRNSDLKSFVQINKRPEATNPPAQTILSTDTFPKPSIKTTIFAARDANSLDFYRRNGDLSKNEQFTTALNPLASNIYGGSGYEIVLCNTQTISQTGASNGNVPFSEIIIYQDKLTAEQVTAVTNFLNS